MKYLFYLLTFHLIGPQLRFLSITLPCNLVCTFQCFFVPLAFFLLSFYLFALFLFAVQSFSILSIYPFVLLSFCPLVLLSCILLQCAQFSHNFVGFSLWPNVFFLFPILGDFFVLSSKLRNFEQNFKNTKKKSKNQTKNPN